MFVDHLPYAGRLDRRALDSVDLVVIHCTELPDLAMAREFGERIHHEESRTGNSGHYYIERSGRVEEWVPPDRVAHHVRGFNERSIGIELDNPGRYPDWFNSRRQQMAEPYTRPQLENLLRLVQVLRTSIPSIRLVSGHEMLDRERIPASDRPEITIRRKVDPGPLFPWDRFLAASGLEFIKAGKCRFEIVSGGPVR